MIKVIGFIISTFLFKSYAEDCHVRVLKSFLSRQDARVSGRVLSDKEIYREIIKSYRHILDYSRHFKISPSLKKSIDDIYNQDNIPRSKKAKKAFELIVENELKVLNPSSRARVEKLIDEFQVTDHFEFNGEFKVNHTKEEDRKGPLRLLGKRKRVIDKPETEIISKMPYEYQETELDYAIRSHEVFHAITFELLTSSKALSFLNSKKDYDKIYKILSKNTLTAYLNESSAMAAEWRYMSTIPVNIRMELIEHIQNHDYLDEYSIKFARRVLGITEPKSAGEHILNEHANSRYDKANLKDLFMEQKYIPMYNKVQALTVLGIVLIDPVIVDICYQFIDKDGSYSKTPFFEYVCLESPKIGTKVKLFIKCKKDKECKKRLAL